MTIPTPPPTPNRALGQAVFSQQVYDWMNWMPLATAEINLIALMSSISTFSEGTFTPVVEGATTAGAGTYTTQIGRYQRIGNRMTFEVYVAWTAHTGTGGIQISGLPVAMVSTGRAACSVISNNISFTAGATLKARILGGSQVVGIVQEPSGGGGLVVVPMDTAGDLTISGSYPL